MSCDRSRFYRDRVCCDTPLKLPPPIPQVRPGTWSYSNINFRRTKAQENVEPTFEDNIIVNRPLLTEFSQEDRFVKIQYNAEPPLRPVPGYGMAVWRKIVPNVSTPETSYWELVVSDYDDNGYWLLCITEIDDKGQVIELDGIYCESGFTGSTAQSQGVNRSTYKWIDDRIA